MGTEVNKARSSAHGSAVMLWCLLATGLLPFLGFLIQGAWSQTELGIGTLLVLFSGRELARAYGGKRRS